MMKRLFTIITLTLLALAFAVPAQAVDRDMWAYVYSWDGTTTNRGEKILVRVTSGITFKVLQRNSDTAETLTIFNDQARTSITNPVTTTSYEDSAICNDQVKFRVDPAETDDTYVDLIVTDTAGGYTAYVEDFSATYHTIVIDQRPNMVHHGVIWYAAAADSATVVDTGIDFDYDTAVHRVTIEVVTAVTGSNSGPTIEVGLLSTQTSGDDNGFASGTALTTAGYITPVAGTTGAFFGSDSTIMYPHFVIYSNASALVYAARSGQAAATGVAGYIHYWFTRTR